jgi:hypothetical protein
MSEQTDREIFDRVKAHLLAQGRPAIGRDGGCAYRGKDGRGDTSCALGCLIPDDVYDKSIEGVTMTPIDVSAGQWTSYVPGGDQDESAVERLATVLNASGIPARNSTRRMLNFLQLAHDNSNDMTRHLGMTWVMEVSTALDRIERHLDPTTGMYRDAVVW